MSSNLSVLQFGHAGSIPFLCTSASTLKRVQLPPWGQQACRYESQKSSRLAAKGEEDLLSNITEELRDDEASFLCGTSHIPSIKPTESVALTSYAFRLVDLNPSRWLIQAFNRRKRRNHLARALVLLKRSQRADENLQKSLSLSRAHLISHPLPQIK